jgi:hypothetical protein
MEEQIKLKNGNVLNIHHDDSAHNPREDGCWNIAQFILFHNRYNIGDKHDIDHGNYTGWSAMAQENWDDDAIVMPVFAYTKRCIDLSLSPFSCPWDSGQVGFAVVDVETINSEFNGDKLKAVKSLKAELEIYTDYLNGNVYGYILETSDGEEIDSCWGFYGTDFANNGLYENAGITKEEVA